jgi:hypothetical protein
MCQKRSALFMPTVSLMRSKFILLVATGLVLTAIPALAQYTAQYLPPPSAGQPAGGTKPYALNNEGQVFGRNFWGGTGIDRGPVLWTNGVGFALPVPAGYNWMDSALGFINDAGVVVSTVQLIPVPPGQFPAVRPVSWQNGNATVIGVPISLDVCASRIDGFAGPIREDRFDVFPVGLNRSGHVLIYACNTLWIVDLNGTVLMAGPPPVRLPQAGLVPVYFEDISQARGNLNDADVAFVETGIPSCTQCTHLGILTGLSGFFPLPLAYGYAKDINNRNEALALVLDSNTNLIRSELWDGGTLVDLGFGGGWLNNVGQVVFMSPSAPQLYKDGSVNPITLPPEASDRTFMGFNDAGQIIAGNDGRQSGVLLTPIGACGLDVTSQVQVAPGGFRYNHSTTHFTQAVTIRSTNGSSIAGPISLALDNLPAQATLFGINGATQCLAPQGSQYTNIVASSLESGGSLVTSLQFINLDKSGVSYQPRVVAGSGRR